MNLTDEFLNRYLREYDYYEAAARLCASQCEKILQENGIRAIVTNRAKRNDRLRDKVEKRNAGKKYQRLEEIYADIVDLAGVRIALYFPGDREQVQSLIEANFEVEYTKEFPEKDKTQPGSYQRKFSGYAASHFRVQMHEEHLPEIQHRYCNVTVEIQVASVLMHAWSEVEHDLVYKPAIGGLSEPEHAILDQINGMVLAGEIALQQLQGAIKRRLETQNKPFSSHFELAAYLYDYFRAKDSQAASDLIMGRADTLLGYLQEIDQAKPQQLAPYLDLVSPNFEDGPIADQVSKLLLQDNPSLQTKYAEPLRESSKRSYWIFPAGSTDTNSALESLRLWLDQNMWGMRKSTAGRARLRPGDLVCFYASKLGIVATAEITGTAHQLVLDEETPEVRSSEEPLYKVPLADVRWLPQPLALDEAVRAELDAFKGRSTTGIWAWFIQTTRRISEHDFWILAAPVKDQ